MTRQQALDLIARLAGVADDLLRAQLRIDAALKQVATLAQDAPTIPVDRESRK